MCYIRRRKGKAIEAALPQPCFYLPLQFALYRQAVAIAVVAAISFFPCKSDKTNSQGRQRVYLSESSMKPDKDKTQKLCLRQ